MSNDSGIALVDNTIPTQPPPDDTLPPKSRRRFLGKRLTKGSTRENHKSRKYAKWQPDRYGDFLEPDGPVNNALSPSQTVSRQPSAEYQSDAPSAEFTSDPATRTDTGRPETCPNREQNRTSHIDVLYENQRGWWFFGVPMFSADSLLNLDPPAWATWNFEESPVNITNAQLPDPSWEWVWKTWYIDMSYDVDEEGWQYSFSFASKFSWHGTHPFPHSFVRRRRWLRKRAKKSTRTMAKSREVNGRDHVLNEDYFSVHPSIDRSYEPRSRPHDLSGQNSVVPSSGVSDNAEEVLPEDIINIPILIKALKRATIDREKIEIISQFIDNADEELVYLPDEVPHILSLFVFRTSRRHLHDRLSKIIDELPTDSNLDSTVKSKRENLQKAIQSINDHSTGVRLWCDVHDQEELDVFHASDRKGKARAPYGLRPDPGFGANDKFMSEIKGIPEKAHIGKDEGHIHRP